MKKITWMLLLIFNASYLIGQDVPPDSLSKKEIRKKKQEEKEAELRKQYELTYELLLNRQFILEAKTVETTTGARFNVNGMLNFIMVDSAISTLQVGSDQRIGVNAAGGYTAQGEIVVYKLSKNDKDKTCTLEMQVRTLSGNYHVYLDTSVYGNHKALVRGFRSGHLIYEGNILFLKDSKAFIGITY